jgi:hypothetical protein
LLAAKKRLLLKPLPLLLHLLLMLLLPPLHLLLTLLLLLLHLHLLLKPTRSNFFFTIEVVSKSRPMGGFFCGRHMLTCLNFSRLARDHSRTIQGLPCSA